MKHWFLHILDPNTRRRLRRFGRIKRAKWSLVLLIAIFVISLFSNFIANDKPFLAKANGKLYFPVFRFYPESEFTGSSVNTRPRYKELEKTPLFAENEKNWMVWPVVRNGPEESLEANQIEIDSTLTLSFSPADQIAVVEVDSSLNMQRTRGAAPFYGASSEFELRRQPLAADGVAVPAAIVKAIEKRFENEKAEALSIANETGCR
jgi:microcin C transport system permease protein